MNADELCTYIKHYMKKDRTRSAILLNGKWGTGKSYFIENCLFPFLSKEENGEYQSVVVSLYGVSTLTEVSQSLFLQLFTPKAEGLGEKGKRIARPMVAGGSFLLQTIVKSGASHFNVDLADPRQLFDALQESIKLENHLVVFEDIERANVKLSEFMGYVNNLVEHNNAKVLLIANESEIKEDDYFRAKEKTISDTLDFECDLTQAMKTIIDSFDDVSLSGFANEKMIKQIQDSCFTSKKVNLRTFLFACQKAVDIFEYVPAASVEQNKHIFYSILIFSQKLKSGETPQWKGSKNFSIELSHRKYPLYRFCYEYIVYHTFDKDLVEPAFSEYQTFILYDRDARRDDPDIVELDNYACSKEKNIFECLQRIEKRLNNPKDIPFYSYGYLMYYLVVCGNIVGFDYSECKRKMISNLKNSEQQIDVDFLFWTTNYCDVQEEQLQLDSFKQDIVNALKESSKPWLQFDYNPKNIQQYAEIVRDNRNGIRQERLFVSNFDRNRLLDFIFSCNASQLDEFRGVLFGIYRDRGRDSFKNKDIEFMKQLLQDIDERQSSGQIVDGIVNRQILFLKDNFKTFIKQIAGENTNK